MSQRDIRSLDVGMLRTFDALMRERSVSRAAARLFLSQPAVSASLNRLREAFGDPLFTRTAHGVVPTGRAQALAPQVEQVLAGIAALLDGDKPFDPASSSRIFRVVGSDHASQLVLPTLGRTLAACGSPLRVVWEPPNTTPLEERLYKGEVDLAMVARLQVPRDMETQTLYEDHYVHVVRRDHPRAAESATLDRFCEIPQVFLGYGTSVLDDMIDETLARTGRQRQVQFAVTSLNQVVHQLQHSDCAAVIASRVARTYAGELRESPVPFELPTYQLLLCWSARAAADPGVQWLKNEIARVVAAQDADALAASPDGSG